MHAHRRGPGSAGTSRFRRRQVGSRARSRRDSGDATGRIKQRRDGTALLEGGGRDGSTYLGKSESTPLLGLAMTWAATKRPSPSTFALPASIAACTAATSPLIRTVI